jgi:hypothetical protein
MKNSIKLSRPNAAFSRMTSNLDAPKTTEEKIADFFKTVPWELVPLTVECDEIALGVIYKSKNTGQAVGIIIGRNDVDPQYALVHMITILQNERYAMCVHVVNIHKLPELLATTESFVAQNPVAPGDLERLKHELTREKPDRCRND